jgi:crotonobetainyl-CoA:carnitine CoA-transferase CaiB-like acyl-CoA transferase
MSGAGALPLDGIRVLDFTHVLAGPFATRIMGDLGADVVKVTSMARPGNVPGNPYYTMWNRNKRSLALDMSDELARETCRALCERADVVIENFAAGVLDRWGVGYDIVREANPGVVYVSMSGMGAEGPWSHFVTYAPTIHALAGLTYLTGVPDHDPIGIGVSHNDHIAGLHATVATLAALEGRRETGRGQRIDLSQFEVGVSLAGPALLDYSANGRVARPGGNALPYDLAAPHDCYPCAGDDRWVAIAVMADAQWRALRTVMGEPPWATDARYNEASGRVADRATLDAGIAAWTREHEAEAVQSLCQAAGVPAGVVQTGADLVERDPQFAHLGFLTTTGDAGADGQPVPIDALPLRFSATPVTQYRAPRELGADNAAVLDEWIGMSETDVRAGEQSGAYR